MKETQLFINGEFLDNGDREMRENINPATEEVISLFPVATEEDVAAAVDAAYEAQKSWEKVPPIERAGYLMELVQLLKENQELMARTNSEEMGKPLKQSMDEAGWLPAYLQYFAALARHMKGEIIPSDRPNENILIYKMPIGVAGQIMPWNFPLFLIGRKVAPALIAGCTVVLKASSDCPNGAYEFAKLVQKSSLPKGVINVITGSGAVTGKGYYYEPTVIADCKHDMRIMKEEIFGPVLPITTFKTLDEAIELANDCVYGLTSSIYTTDYDTVMRAMNEIKFGETYVNREHFEAFQGFHQGVRQSGIGGEDGERGLEEYLETHICYIDWDLKRNKA